MADIFRVAEIIEQMADGFESEVMSCLDENKDLAVQAIHEQLWSGLDGDDSHLEPNYDNDSYFEQKGYWYKRNDDYKAWKLSITPPTAGWLLNVPPRPYNVPNLYIDGTFYDTIEARASSTSLSIGVNSAESLEIVNKWGDNILRLGTPATDYFCFTLILPRVWEYFANCGW